ncbi:extracellular solute-binding protein [Microbacterium ulmi]|uniref:Extracellular solute-binding protein n=1 Tax=Microbacterium ulmi TaxID=179095 RepID=A0A7Y2LZM8_9MICO|nr:extracellular solute-binding protein [Microbacterium ulmi]NII69873.1 putative spermidine/putrescine transport system substrate-binding protein [Microbacterium ulmi]NNH03795.1 extracellular solute-binding protein [Microbacterium ulmi]
MSLKRHSAAAALLALSVFAVTACSASSEPTAGSGAAADGEDSRYAGDGQVVYAGFGGTGADAMQAAWFDPFADASGIELVRDDAVSWIRLQEMVDAGAMEWDVAQGNISYGVTDNPDLEYLDCEIINCAAFDNAGYPAYPQAVPLLSLAAVLTYNTDRFDKGELTGLRDFFDPTIEGMRTIGPITNGWHGTLEAALIADGVDREDLYPLDVERALSVLDRIKDRLIIAQDNQQCINDVSTGESVLGICNNGRVAIAAQEGYPVAIAWGLQIQEADYVYIPKGAPHLENAQKLIAYIVDHQAAISNEIAYGALNPDAEGLSPDSPYIDFVPTQHELDGDQAPIRFDLDWWGENRPAVIERITEWIAG